MHEFELAKDKLLMGAERRSMAMTEHERINTAYHESGHTIVGRLMPDHDPVYKVSIIPRGRALGVTMYLPEQDRYSQSKQYLLSNICTLFAGRIAEGLMFGDDAVTTGASNDIERATDIARKMVTRWGMSKRLPPMQFDQDISEIVNSCYARAKEILEQNKDILEAMKDALLKYETLDAEQIDDLMARRPCRAPAVYTADPNNRADSGTGSTPQQPAQPQTQSEPPTQPEPPKSEPSQQEPQSNRPYGPFVEQAKRQEQEEQQKNDGENK